MAEIGDKVIDQQGIYFITIAVVEWIEIFIRSMYPDIVVESLSYCIPYEVNLIKMYVKDREKVRRTSYKEIKSLCQTGNELIKVAKKQKVKAVLVIPKLTITPDKIFYIEVHRKSGWAAIEY
jgi:hypothetical protein